MESRVNDQIECLERELREMDIEFAAKRKQLAAKRDELEVLLAGREARRSVEQQILAEVKAMRSTWNETVGIVVVWRSDVDRKGQAKNHDHSSSEEEGPYEAATPATSRTAHCEPFFTAEEEKEIVSLLPTKFVDNCYKLVDAEGIHLHSGLFLGQFCWSNIKCTFERLEEPIPARIEEILTAKGAPKGSV
jgi:hypothetical protein